jgi:hypothetical protein
MIGHRGSQHDPAVGVELSRTESDLRRTRMVAGKRSIANSRGLDHPLTRV